MTLLNPNLKSLFTEALKKSWIILVFGSQLAQGTVALDVNDVSYLWPPAVQNSEIAALIPLNQVIPESTFQEVMAFSQGQTLQNKTLPTPVHFPEEALGHIQNWYIAAMRIDPCAPGLAAYKGDSQKCLQEIRLVAQPFLVLNDLIDYHDYALHILFELSAGDPKNSQSFATVLNQLLQLKQQNKEAGVDTTGVPLKIHPGFTVPGFSKKLNGILLASLQTARLKKITFTGAASADGPWAFFQGLIQNQHFVLESDPTLHNLPFGSISPELPGNGGSISPSPDNINWPISDDGGHAPSAANLFFKGTIDLKNPAILADASESKVFKIEDLVNVFDNPQITNRTNTDCFSCHTSTSRAALLNLVNEPNQFKYQAPNDHTTLTPVLMNKSITSFRTFGWFGSRGVVSRRVINESAEVANLIEKIY
ncbi:MAG TPA: hypothetical protein VN132_05090 [Bdellovibrio sp.]|nr:hypothetical protein [Bdellovibrio sp.]